MRERYIPAFIMLIAGAITSFLNIFNKVELMTGLKRLLIVIIIFYILGLFIKGIIHVALIRFSKKETTDEDQEETNQPEEKNS